MSVMAKKYRLKLSPFEQMADAQEKCVPCKLCGGKAVISDAGTGAGYYIRCENSGAFRAAMGCMVSDQRLGGWAYNVMDWWNRLHATQPPLPEASGDVELREALMKCLDQFTFYADEHRKAGKDEKAATNQRFADLCAEALSRPEAGSMRALWRPISQLSDIYTQPIWIASPKLIHGDANPLGISEAYWQDTDGPEKGEWRCVDFDMCNDEFQTGVLFKDDVTHFLIPDGPWSVEELEELEQ